MRGGHNHIVADELPGTDKAAVRLLIEQLAGPLQRHTGDISRDPGTALTGIARIAACRTPRLGRSALLDRVRIDPRDRRRLGGAHALLRPDRGLPAARWRRLLGDVGIRVSRLLRLRKHDRAVEGRDQHQGD